MNFKKPSKKTLVDAAVLTGGAVGGAALSRVIFGEIPLTPPATGTDFKKIGARAAFIILGTVGAASVSGSDLGSTGMKGAFAGMAIQQGIELIADFAKANPTTAALANSSTKVSMIKARALGLNCACDATPGMYGTRKKRPLRAAVIDMGQYGMEAIPMNAYEAKFLDAKKYA